MKVSKFLFLTSQIKEMENLFSFPLKDLICENWLLNLQSTSSIKHRSWLFFFIFPSFNITTKPTQPKTLNKIYSFFFLKKLNLLLSLYLKKWANEGLKWTTILSTQTTLHIFLIHQRGPILQGACGVDFLLNNNASE